MFSISRLFGYAAIIVALGICFGAFGAHALKYRLDEYSTSVYEKAVFYHLIHALGMLCVCLASSAGFLSVNSAQKIYAILFAGIVFFSGSLYVLALSGMRWLGAITPIGGTLFIIAWLWLAFESVKNSGTH